MARHSLHALTLAGVPGDRFISDHHAELLIEDMRTGFASNLIEQMRGRSVMIVTEHQLPTVLAALTLDGVASRILLCPPDLAPHLPVIARLGQADIMLTDVMLADDKPAHPDIAIPRIDIVGAVLYALGPQSRQSTRAIDRSVETQWVLFTSGTTGIPKLVVHTLASLTGANLTGPLDDNQSVASGAVWSTFYDIRRYGGMQILLRALLGGGSMVLSSATEPVDKFLTRLAKAGVSHLSGTPSHWRRVLMSPQAQMIDPAYVRLSGEIADQTILNRLKQTYPRAEVAHAYATSEAGVGFEVRDGRAGFPETLINNPTTKAALRVINGTLHVRSSRCALGYLNGTADLLKLTGTPDGFVDTGDIVIRTHDRYHFKGRREGVINVGGQKVYPEEVEAVLDLHPAIQITRVYGRRNPVTGALVTADIVLADPGIQLHEILDSLTRHCRSYLAAWKIPVRFKPVDAIALNPAGKVARTDTSQAAQEDAPLS